MIFVATVTVRVEMLGVMFRCWSVCFWSSLVHVLHVFFFFFF